MSEPSASPVSASWWWASPAAAWPRRGWRAARGARVTVTDRRAATRARARRRATSATTVELALGGHDAADFTGADLIVVSPGVPLALPEIQGARRQGVPVLAEVELAARLLPASRWWGSPARTARAPPPRWRARSSAATGGSSPAATWARRCASWCSPARTWTRPCVELSSFQLEGIDRLRPRVAALLNVTPDHLDRYRDLDDYALRQGAPLHEPGGRRLRRGERARPSARRARRLLARRRCSPSGSAGPRRAPRATREDSVEVSVARTRRLRAGAVPRSLARAARAAQPRERHGRALCARAMGLPGAEVQAGLDAFPGLPHRLRADPRAGRRGVDQRLQGHQRRLDPGRRWRPSPPGGPHVVLILGGRGKRAPYAPLRALLAGRVKALLTIGEDAPAIERELGDLRPTERAGTLAAAVRRAAHARQPRRRRSSSPRPAPATTSSGATSSAARRSAGSSRSCPDVRASPPRPLRPPSAEGGRPPAAARRSLVLSAVGRRDGLLGERGDRRRALPGQLPLPVAAAGGARPRARPARRGRSRRGTGAPSGSPTRSSSPPAPSCVLVLMPFIGHMAGGRAALDQPRGLLLPARRGGQAGARASTWRTRSPRSATRSGCSPSASSPTCWWPASLMALCLAREGPRHLRGDGGRPVRDALRGRAPR